MGLARFAMALSFVLVACAAAAPLDDELLLKTCRTESTLNPVEQQIAACSEIIASSEWDTEAKASALNSRGRAYARKLRDLDKAIEDFDRAVVLKPDFAFAFQNRGSAWLNKGDTTRAIHNFDRAVALHPRMPLLLRDRGFALMSRGDYGDALRDFDKIANQSSEDSEAYLFRCWTRLHAAKPDLTGALSDCTQSINFGEGASAHLARGIVEWQMGEKRSALVDFNASLNEDPDLAGALHMRGVALSALGDTNGDREQVRAKALLPAMSDIIASCGEAALCPAAAAQGDRGAIWCDGGPSVRLDQQITGCTEVIRSAPNQDALVRAYNKRSRAYLRMNAKEEALSDMNAAIALDGTYAAAFLTRGYIASHRGRYEDALPEYDRAISLSPRYAAAYFYRAIAKKNSGDYNGAIADFDRATQLDSTYCEAFAFRGLVYAMQGEYRRAIRDYDQAIALDGDYALALDSRSEARQALGDSSRAAQDRAKAIRLNPAYGEDRD